MLWTLPRTSDARQYVTKIYDTKFYEGVYNTDNVFSSELLHQMGHAIKIRSKTESSSKQSDDHVQGLPRKCYN